MEPNAKTPETNLSPAPLLPGAGASIRPLEGEPEGDLLGAPAGPLFGLLAIKLSFILEPKLTGAKACFPTLPLTIGPTCHIWLTVDSPLGRAHVAKIVITPEESTAETEVTS